MKPFEESDRYEYDLTPSDVVLDCGGYEGRFADEISRRYGCTVHVLEPVERFYEQIAKRFEGRPNIRVHNFGIGGKSEFKKFSIKGDMTGAFADSPETETVEIHSVPSVWHHCHLGELALLKLNIEGSEFDVLHDLFESFAHVNVRNIQVQWHDVVPDATVRFHALQERLARTHHLTFDHGWVWQNWRLNEK